MGARDTNTEAGFAGARAIWTTGLAEPYEVQRALA
jgi:hypothetical protein